GDDETGAAHRFDRIDLGDIDAARPGEEPPRFDNDTGTGEIGVGRQQRGQFRQASLDGGQIEGRFTRIIGNTKATAKIDGIQRASQPRGDVAGDAYAVAPLIEQRRRIEDLRAAINVHADEIELVALGKLDKD